MKRQLLKIEIINVNDLTIENKKNYALYTKIMAIIC